jgi:hypothetical protein
MRFSTRILTILCGAMFAFAGLVNTAQAQALFTDDFEDRITDQQYIGNDWTWFQQDFVANTCDGAVSGTYGPYDTDPAQVLQDNRNYWTASADFGQGDSYYRAGLEVPAWDGATTNMLRVYGNRYNTYGGCQRVLVFEEMSIASSGDFTFSFDVAQDRYGAPANGEIIGAFVKVLMSSNGSFDEMLFQAIPSLPPAATSPADVTTQRQSIDFTIPEGMVGELLQFGFHSDLSPNLGQSWATSGAYYDNVELSAAEVIPPGGGFEGNTAGVPLPLWALLCMAGLLALVGGMFLRSQRKT